jgi:3-deoxy-manno-octulosonate cytidylyltransferase (CMP-KDO synthetase)
MRPIVVIPARMAAQRLPGKPLADIGGAPMIVHAVRRALEADIGPVMVAAGDPEIAEAVAAEGARAVLTDPNLPSGTDRVLAALAAADPGEERDAVINLQGDMPFAPAEALRACAEILATRNCEMSTVVAPETSPEDRANVDVVKAVLSLAEGGREGRALYFTRSTLYGDQPVFRHIGVYGYRRAALQQLGRTPPSPLERREKLEQLRALELGMAIWAAVTAEAPISVDNAADLAAARAQAEALGLVRSGVNS